MKKNIWLSYWQLSNGGLIYNTLNSTYILIHIYTDQRSLIHLSDQRLNTHWQQKVFSKLLGLQYKIIYKQGISNRVADALSRRPHVDHTMYAISTCEPSWITLISDGYASNPYTKDILAKLSVCKDSVKNFTLQEGLLVFKGKLWIGNNPSLHLQILSALHAAPASGHSGFPVTYRRLKQLFAWKGMKTLTKDYVSQCQTCLQAKPDRSKYAGLLQPLPIPSSAWQAIPMNFVEGLPMSKNKNCIMVVVDRFTKYGHFIPLAHPFCCCCCCTSAPSLITYTSCMVC